MTDDTILVDVRCDDCDSTTTTEVWEKSAFAEATCKDCGCRIVGRVSRR